MRVARRLWILQRNVGAIDRAQLNVKCLVASGEGRFSDHNLELLYSVGDEVY